MNAVLGFSLLLRWKARWEDVGLSHRERAPLLNHQAGMTVR
jgi:hypothetical protein